MRARSASGIGSRPAHARDRRDALIAALARHLPAARPAGIAAGLHMTVAVPDAPDEAALLEAAGRHGVGLATLSQHRLLAGTPALLLGYGRIPEPSIDAGVGALAGALRAASSR